MIPRGKLLALLMIFVAVGGIGATGAFTTVQADRAASVSTAGDSASLLQIDPVSGTEFAEQDGSEVAINFNNGEADSGVNLDSETLDDGVITITNNGDESVTISASTQTVSGATIKFYVSGDDVSVDDTANAVELSENNEVPTDDSLTRYVVDSQSNGVTIGSGDDITLGLYVSVDENTSGSLFSSSDGDSDAVDITADATTTGNAPLSEGTSGGA
jgi:Protein of unknown function (DUF1102).